MRKVYMRLRSGSVIRIDEAVHPDDRIEGGDDLRSMWIVNEDADEASARKLISAAVSTARARGDRWTQFVAEKECP